MVCPEHVALGLDLMSGGNWQKDFNTTRYPMITEALLKNGYSNDANAKLTGENWLRLLEEAKVQ